MCSKHLKEIFIYFGRLGLTGFGGPLALVSTIQKDLVEKRGWITLHDFSQAFALIKAMPGPVAFQTSVFMGRARGGFLGALIAGVMVNLPAFVAMVLLGAFEDSFEASPVIRVAMVGMQAAALGLILASVKGLFWSYRKRSRFWSLLVIGGTIVYLLPAWEPVLIMAGGLTSIAIARVGSGRRLLSFAPLFALERFPLFGNPTSLAIATAGSVGAAFIPLAWRCFKAGAFVFGSGIAIVPLMENDFVKDLHWLTHSEFMNALAFGQITPGPVVITATFIGFKVLGLAGAFVATTAIFLAPFIHMTTWFPHAMKKLSQQHWIGDFLLGALAVVTAAVLSSVVGLAFAGDFSPIHYFVLVLTFVCVLSGRVPAWAMIPASGLIVVLFNFAVGI